jgi:hypothetical protein
METRPRRPGKSTETALGRLEASVDDPQKQAAGTARVPQGLRRSLAGCVFDEPGGKSPRTFQCLDCDRPDSLKSDPLG